MKLIQSNSIRSYVLARRMSIMNNEISSYQVYGDKIVGFIDNNGLEWKIKDCIKYVRNDGVSYRDIKSIEKDEHITTLHFARYTYAYNLILPLTDFPYKEYVFNAYLSDGNIIVQMTYPFKHDNKLKIEYKDDYNILYKVKVKEKYKNDVAKILNSKPSQISSDARHEIIFFNDGLKDNGVMATYKDDELIKELMDKFGINKSYFQKNDVELIEKIKMKNEEIKDDDLIKDNSSKEVNEVKPKRKLPPGVFPIEDIILRGLNIDFGNENDI